MKRLITIGTMVMALSAAGVTDTYRLTLRLRVPQVFDNSQSTGYRKYQTQKVTGTVRVTYDGDLGWARFSFGGLTNHTFRAGGRKVTYRAPDDETPNWVYIGNNGTGRFTEPCVKFDVECEPSYSLSGLTDGSSLILTCAGRGSSYEAWKCCRVPKRLVGYCAGTLGCGCTDYGHVSPTRLAWHCGPLRSVACDVAPVFGRFVMKFVKSERKCD